LLAIGLAYQNSGIGDARAVFERVAREFGDQKDATASARARLAMMDRKASKSQTDSAAPRRILPLGDGSVQTVSSDGGLVAIYTSDLDLVVRNVLTGDV